MATSPPQLPDRPPVGTLYPELTAAAFRDDQNFRLSEVRRVRDHLEEEAQRRGATLKRYKRAANALAYAGVATNCLAAGCGGAAVGTLAAGITAPASLVLGAVALGSGGIATACTTAGNLLSRRITKYGRIETTARTHHDTVSAVVSKALADQNIGHDEYAVVLQQLELFRQQKAKYQAGSRAGGVDFEKAKNELKAQVRAEVGELFSGRVASR